MKDGKVGTKLLTLDDLAERWSVSRKVALRMVRAHSIPFILVGQVKADLSRRGPKSYRFRPETIEEWERGGERSHKKDVARGTRRERELRAAGVSDAVKDWLL